MRIEKVTAGAFGPLHDETLELAPGMTVICGDNESAKSSWHAAIYAALCGRRRGRGASTKEDQEFADRHRPWTGSAWKVGCTLELDDGRRVELSQDLAGKVDCCATEMSRGKDLSDEIGQEGGAVDGSRWLGLNRNTFAATACINQGQMLTVLHAAAKLQDDLQRAAATGGTDATAAKAIDAIEDYKRQHVGKDQRNSTKPLRLARMALERAELAASDARAAHDDYLHLVAEAEQAREADERSRRAATEAGEAVEALEQLVAAARDARLATDAADRANRDLQELAARASELRSRAHRAAELATCFPDGEPPARVAEDDLTRRVTAALAGWRAAPDVPALGRPTALELQEQLDRLPEQPEGDLEVDPVLRSLLSRYQQSRAVLDATTSRRPALGVSDVARLDAELRAALDQAKSRRQAVRQELHEAERAQTAAEDTWRRESASHMESRQPRGTVRAATAGGAVLAVAGLVLLLLGQSLAGAALLALGAGTGMTGLLRGRNTATAPTTARSTYSPSEVTPAPLEIARNRVSSAQKQLVVAEREVVEANARRTAVTSWRAEYDAAQRTCTEAEQRVRVALDQRGCPGGDVEVAFADYERQCAERLELAQHAVRRVSLQRQVQERQDAERAAARALRIRTAAVDAVLDAATATGSLPAAGRGKASSPAKVDAFAEGLQRWLDGSMAEQRQHEQRRAEWVQLQTLLEGRSIGELQQSVEELVRALADARTGAERQSQQAVAATAQRDLLAAAVGIAVPSEAAEAEGALGTTLSERRRHRAQAQEVRAAAAKRADKAEGTVGERARCLPDVAAAEEDVERAHSELHRIERLERTLDLTHDYLVAAQERVHDQIAPRLRETLDRWLPQVTAGRYTRSTVEPTTLEVKVASTHGTLRPAKQLSVGTLEQVYLLLRMALAEHLTDEGTTCPLLLDDVTVQADPRRTEAILDTCLSLAQEGRQVVLFAQEPAVAQWARQHLHEPRHKLIRLEVVPVE